MQKTIIIRADPALHARVRDAAWADRRSMQQWLVVAIEEKLAQKPAKKGKP